MNKWPDAFSSGVIHYKGDLASWGLIIGFRFEFHVFDSNAQLWNSRLLFRFPSPNSICSNQIGVWLYTKWLNALISWIIHYKGGLASWDCIVGFRFGIWGFDLLGTLGLKFKCLTLNSGLRSRGFHIGEPFSFEFKIFDSGVIFGLRT